MANLNVNSWNPNKVIIDLSVFTASKPGADATWKEQSWKVPSITRPDGAAAAVSTGGVATVRFIVDSATFHCSGENAGAIGTSLKFDLLNQTNSAAAVATVTDSTTDDTTVQVLDTIALTLSTSTDSRGTVATTMARTVLLAGDVIYLSMTSVGTSTVGIGSKLQVVGHWEEQLQIAA